MRTRKPRENHGLTTHPLYRKWQDMVYRCHNPGNQKYPWYGALGATVCPEWRESAKAFIDWCLSHNWQPGMEIDKDIKVPGCKLYSPDTCSLVSHRQNMIAVVGRDSGRKTAKLKLTSGEVAELLKRKMAGESTRHLAQAYGVSISRVNTLYRQAVRNVS